MAVNSAIEILRHPHRKAGRPQALAAAGGAGHRRHVVREPFAVIGGGVAIISAGSPGCRETHRLQQCFSRGSRVNFSQGVFSFDAQRASPLPAPWSITARSGARARARLRAGLRGVRDHFVRIESPGAAEARAFLAGPIRAVERKRAWLEFRHARPALHAGELARIEALFAVDHRDQHQAVGQARGGFDGSFQALLDARLDQQTVDDNFDRVIAALVERDCLFERTDDAVDPRPDESLAREFLQILPELALRPRTIGAITRMRSSGRAKARA